ncbi:unnamed protein product [Leptidea sinapis]|uniref:Secreted protein n=1 Tax=Leptidea sinapis TaxID=189913 RepID=A0A5E4QWH0_9NEOP|nr:unnamed protein product [Leptidea sinapis]
MYTFAAWNLLRSVLASHLPLCAKLCVYKTYVCTRLTYAAPAWFALASETGADKRDGSEVAASAAVADAPHQSPEHHALYGIR